VSTSEVTTILEHVLGVLEASQRVLANNVANANTPNFTPTRISFADSLRQAMQSSGSISLRVTSPGHIRQPSARPALVTAADDYAAGRTDESKFDVDREMVEVLKNSSSYDVFSSILRGRYQQVRDVLRMP